MEITPKIWERSKTDKELHLLFQKIIRINRVHSKLPLIEASSANEPPEKHEFYNFVSIIINPEQDSSLKKIITNFYEGIDFSLLLSFFYAPTSNDPHNLNLDAIAKLKRLFDQVI